MAPLSSIPNEGIERPSREIEIQAQHSSFIGLIITQVERIKKECKSRRYRVSEFKFILWSEFISKIIERLVVIFYHQ